MGLWLAEIAKRSSRVCVQMQKEHQNVLRISQGTPLVTFGETGQAEHSLLEYDVRVVGRGGTVVRENVRLRLRLSDRKVNLSSEIRKWWSSRVQLPSPLHPYPPSLPT